MLMLENIASDMLAINIILNIPAINYDPTLVIRPLYFGPLVVILAGLLCTENYWIFASERKIEKSHQLMFSRCFKGNTIH